MNYNLRNYEQNKCFRDSGVDLSDRALTDYMRGPGFKPQDQKTKTSDKNTPLFSCSGQAFVTAIEMRLTTTGLHSTSKPQHWRRQGQEDEHQANHGFSLKSKERAPATSQG